MVWKGDKRAGHTPCIWTVSVPSSHTHCRRSIVVYGLLLPFPWSVAPPDVFLMGLCSFWKYKQQILQCSQGYYQVMLYNITHPVFSVTREEWVLIPFPAQIVAIGISDLCELSCTCQEPILPTLHWHNPLIVLCPQEYHSQKFLLIDVQNRLHRMK